MSPAVRCSDSIDVIAIVLLVYVSPACHRCNCNVQEPLVPCQDVKKQNLTESGEGA